MIDQVKNFCKMLFAIIFIIFHFRMGFSLALGALSKTLLQGVLMTVSIRAREGGRERFVPLSRRLSML